MGKRIGISNKLRFEVFKRDSFKCQYCGKSAPTVILNVDHIDPVAKGGGADILNLITSCFECNSGKSDRKLDDSSIVSIQKKQLDELNERRSQLDMLIQWKKIITNNSYEVESVVKFFNEKNDCNISLTDTGIRNLKALMKKHPIEKILDAINELYDKFFGELSVEDMWDKLPRFVNFVSASEDDKNKMKFFGAIKARFTDTSGYNLYNTVEINKMLRKLYEIIDDKSAELTYSDLFKILNSNISYRGFSTDIYNLFNEHFE